jgi:hypothetical protein
MTQVAEEDAKYVGSKMLLADNAYIVKTHRLADAER